MIHDNEKQPHPSNPQEPAPVANEDEAINNDRPAGDEAPTRNAESVEAPQGAAAEPAPSPTPKRGPRLRTILVVVFAAAVFFAIGMRWGGALLSGTRRVWEQVVGPTGEVAAQDDGEAGTSNQFWTCGMHPWVILPEPGLCPICHMELTPLDPAKLTGEIAIDPVIVQNIGVRVASVTAGPLTREIRTVGTIGYDEASVRDVNTKISGWIEELYVDETGAVVQQGSPLFDLYSPELYQAQTEYLVARRTSSAATRSLAESARTKLEYFDITPEQIRELEERGKASKTLTVSSPHTGVVIEKNAHEGMKIEPGMRVYRIADLSSVWVMATFYEYQLPYIKVGQSAVMTLPYLPGETFEGEVVYIYPYLQEQSRQVKVRLEFPNPDRTLKPGMFANIELTSTLDRQAVLAPREAIIATGKRQVAFVSQGEGKFEPREVDTGVETESGLVEILDGLKPGEKVVTSGQFLLDSESKMRAALAKMVRGEMASEQAPETEVAEATVLAPLPSPAAERLNRMLSAYLTIGDHLTSNRMDDVDSQAQQVVAAMDTLVEIPLPGKPDYWKKSPEAAAVRGSAAELAEAEDLDAARMLYASLSRSLAGLVEETGVPASYGERVELLTCPMYPPKEGGAVWLQAAGQARNPYMGQGPMLRCVGERKLLPVAGPEEPRPKEMAAESL